VARRSTASPHLAPEQHDPDIALDDTLHVTNGESAARGLRLTGFGGTVLAWNDVLHEGPLPRLPPAELRRRRAAFLSECGWGSDREIAADLERRDRFVERALQGRRHVVLWFEHDLFDQLQLLQILASYVAARRAEARVEILNVGEVEGRPDFRGLGELTPIELEGLWDRRRPLTAEPALATRAWEAVCSPEPTAIEALLAGPTEALPFLGAALHRLLEEFPDTTSGLSRTERQLLEALAEAPRTPLELLVDNGRREEAPFMGDAWLWLHLAELGRGPQALVFRDDGEPLGLPPPRADGESFASARVRLTEPGERALAGTLDRIAVAGIDRWIGGVHLHRGHIWRWDRGRRHLVRR
jgi:Domain of unknown function (DUF1835)